MPRNKIAFIHTGAWGDLYVATAALASVCQEFAGGGLPVSIVGSDKWMQIVDRDSFPNVQEIIVSQNGFQGEIFRLTDTGWGSAGKISLVSFFRNVSVSFNLRTESLRYAWAPFLAGVPRRQGSAPSPWGFLYSQRAPWLGKDPILHERDRLLQVVEGPGKLGVLASAWSESRGLPVLRKPNQILAERLARAQFGQYWLINPTASRREKAWPAAKFRELFEKLSPELSAKGFALRLLGSPTETEWLREVIPPGFEFESVVVQPPSIHDLVDVISGAGLLITNTSSAQFLAPGAGVSCITLMGRADPRIWGPLGSDDVVVRGEVDPELAGQMWAQERSAYESISVKSVEAACAKFLRTTF